MDGRRRDGTTWSKQENSRSGFGRVGTSEDPGGVGMPREGDRQS